MAAILSKIGFARKPSSKVYNNMNPPVSGMKLFDPDLELEPNRKHTRASHASAINQLEHRSSRNTCRNKHRNDFCKSGSFENRSVKVLQNFSVKKAEDTTERINGCLKVAEEMRGGASRILVNLNQQNEQITHTHQTAATIDHVLQRGEKLLGSLGGLFSRNWKPRKSREIKGPVLTKEKSISRKGYNMEQRQKLGLTAPCSQSNPRRFSSGSLSALERVELEKAKQDDSLSELSNLLGKLKAMAVDMGSELDGQNKALDRMEDDVDELNARIKGANHRARHLLR